MRASGTLRMLTAFAVLSAVFALSAPARGQEEKVLYSCGFESGPGIFRPMAEGKGAAAALDDTVAHSGRYSVKLVDEGGDDADLTWRHEWTNWQAKAHRASLQWARSWDPKRTFPLHKGESYEVRAYVKTKDAYGLGIEIVTWGKSGSPVRGQPERYSPIISGTHDWEWIAARVSCTSGDGELDAIKIALMGKGTAWVDDVRIVSYPQEDMPSVNYGVYPPLRCLKVRAETASWISATFIGDLHYQKAQQAESWSVSSTDDPRFRQGVRPVKVGRIRQLANPDGKLSWQDTFRHVIYLRLPRPLRSGKHYTVTMLGVGAERQDYALAFDDVKDVNDNIKANQYGYLPDAMKYAYLGGWLGSAGALPLAQYATRFNLVDAATGKTVYGGKPTLRMSHTHKEDMSTSTLHNLTGEDVYQCDFSSFTTPGKYFIQVPGMGRSYAFSIGREVYARPFYLCARAFLYQRCGIALKGPYSDYVRGACHREPAREIRATMAESGSESEDALVKKDPSIVTGKTLDIWGGYHDAADYDRLIGHDHIPAALFQLYEMSPQAFTDRQLNLPESGDGLPDIVDEALWQVDFDVRMQDADSGGVRGGAGPNAAVTAPADKDANPIYVYMPDALASLSFAGDAAQAARVLTGLGRERAAASYLDHARKAWRYALSHDGKQYPIAYAFAAVELFRATGQKDYHDAFLSVAGKMAKEQPVAASRYGGVCVWNVWMAYLTCRRPGVDKKVRQAFRQKIVSAADYEIRVMESNAYRMPNTVGKPVRYGWGCGTNFPAGEFCVLAWRVTGQKRYRDYALLAGDFSLGCDPTDMVYITGVGRNHIKWCLHSLSDPMATQVKAPVARTVPGIPIFGIHAYPPNFSGWDVEFLYIYGNPSHGVDNFYPPARSWPDLHLFADVGWPPIIAEHQVNATELHSTFLYGALLGAGEEKAPDTEGK